VLSKPLTFYFVKYSIKNIDKKDSEKEERGGRGKPSENIFLK